MVPALRKAFNDAFSKEKYNALLQDLDDVYPGAIEFRLAESPVFIPDTFARQMFDACDHIIDLILDPGFKKLTERAIPTTDRVPNENDHSHFLAFDFGVCIGPDGQYHPQLIELQGFASLYGFQSFYPDTLRKHFPIPDNYSQYLNGLDHDTYLALLKRTILEDCPPEHAIILELNPHEQKTRVDFYCTRDYLGIQPVNILDLIQEGKRLYYNHPVTGQKTHIRRIYNRVIFDELNAAAPTLPPHVDIRQDLDVEWIAHPNWFYRISKFMLPLIHHPNVPQAFFLNELKQPPPDLDRYVLKPLFSFAGQGVIIDLTPADLDNIKDPENYILQKKVTYADLIPTPDIPAKVEIRLMYLWKDGDARPTPAINLCRLSKGKMIGTRYNKDREWVGGSTGYFERP